MYKQGLVVGGFLMMIGIILGAFGAHALKPILDESAQVSFETAVKYQFYMSIMIMITSIVSFNFQSKKWSLIGNLLTLGTVLFSGSIYLLVALKANGQIGLGGLGIITPIGGTILIIALLLFVIEAFKIKNLASKQ